MIRVKKKVLYIFLTHKKNYIETLNKVSLLTYPAIVVVGGEDTYLDKKTLYVKTPDNYDGLPQKVYEALTYLITVKEFKKYTHFCKLDEDMEINQLFTQKILFKLNYGGNVQYSEGDRYWGKNKFSKNSKFANSPYMGNYVPWCKGGYGYLVSRYAIDQIKNLDILFDDEPYEDLLIAKLLNKKEIYPKNIKNLYKFISSKSHN